MQEFKTTKDKATWRQYKNFRNQATAQISREHFVLQVKKFTDEDLKTPKQKWQLLKIETGQVCHTTPTMIREGQTQHTSPKEMAQALNRLYIQAVRKIKNSMPPLPRIHLRPTPNI